MEKKYESVLNAGLLFLLIYFIMQKKACTHGRPSFA